MTLVNESAKYNPPIYFTKEPLNYYIIDKSSPSRMTQSIILDCVAKKFQSSKPVRIKWTEDNLDLDEHKFTTDLSNNFKK